MPSKGKVLRKKALSSKKLVLVVELVEIVFREIATRTENVKASWSAVEIIASPSNRDNIYFEK